MLPQYTTDPGFIQRFWSHVTKSDDCWLWKTGCTPAGYGETFHGGTVLYTHRVSWELAYGPIPDGLSVCHHCDVRHCVRPDHLFVGTQLDNIRDMWAKGRHDPLPIYHGEQNANSKLTENDIRSLRAARAAGARPKDLAIIYGIDRHNVWAICTRKAWKHVT